MTAWAIIALLEADYPHREPIERGLALIMSRQQKNGEWLQEAIEGVFNKSCMVSFLNEWREKWDERWQRVDFLSEL